MVAGGATFGMGTAAAPVYGTTVTASANSHSDWGDDDGGGGGGGGWSDGWGGSFGGWGWGWRR
jgi:hypothetical protein